MLSRSVLTPKVETNKKNLHHHEERDKVGGPQVLENRKFFLDIKGRYPTSLVTDIKSLGGVSFSFLYFCLFKCRSRDRDRVVFSIIAIWNELAI